MPFTPSHAVVALAFVRTPLAPAAVAVGAMTPDLPLFVRGTPLSYGLTHSFAWIPVTAVVALVLLLIWRCALRPAARELSPRWLAARLSPRWDQPAASGFRETFARPGQAGASGAGAGLLVLALVAGVASHIVWDLFTHEGRWGAAVLPFLDRSWGPLPGYRWLQYSSSVLGLAVLAGWALQRLRRADAAASVARIFPPWVRWAWWVSLPVILLAAWVLGSAALGPLTTEFTLAHLAHRVLPPACAVWGAATILLCIAAQARARSASLRPQPGSQAAASRPHRRGAGKAVGPPT